MEKRTAASDTIVDGLGNLAYECSHVALEKDVLMCNIKFELVNDVYL